MCGRFALTSNPKKIKDAFPGVVIREKIVNEFASQSNITPTMKLLTVCDYAGTPMVLLKSLQK